MSDLEQLHATRDAFVEGMRALIERVEEDTPEAELRGIVGRAGQVLRGAAVHLDTLADLDFSSADPDEILRVLSRAQHLPRMVLAFGQVLHHEEKSTAWVPAQLEAMELISQLSTLVQEWLASSALDPRQLLGELDEEFDEEFDEDEFDEDDELEGGEAT